MKNQIDYLNLEIIKTEHKKVNLIEGTHSCYFKNFNHSLHSENEQLNTLTDLVITLATKIEIQETKNYNLWKNVLESLKDKNKILSQLVENIDYIKNQNKEICSYFKDLEKYKEDRKLQKVQLDNYQTKIITELNQSHRQVINTLEKLEKIILS